MESMQENSSQEHLLTAEVWFPPLDEDIFPSTCRGIARNSRTQAIFAIRTGANIIVAVLQIGRRIDFMVTRLKQGGHQNGAGRLCILG